MNAIAKIGPPDWVHDAFNGPPSTEALLSAELSGCIQTLRLAAATLALAGFDDMAISCTEQADSAFRLRWGVKP